MTGYFDHCLWGAAVGGRGASDAARYGSTDTATRQSDLETAYGRAYEVIRVYTSDSDWVAATNINTARNQAIVTAGQTLWWSMRASGPGSTTISWPSIASGSRDAEIRGHADAMKAIYNTTGKNLAGTKLIATFHHEASGDNTNVASDFVAAFQNYRTVFLARMASNTGGTAFAGTIYFGPILHSFQYDDGTVAQWWPGDAYSDFCGADAYNWWPDPGHGSNFANVYREFKHSRLTGSLVAYAKTKLKPAFMGEVGCFEREPPSFDPLQPASATNVWDGTTTSPTSLGAGPPYNADPPNSVVLARDPGGTFTIDSAAAWTDHVGLQVGSQVFPDHSLVIQVLCWFDQAAVFNRMTNSSNERVAAMAALASSSVFNTGATPPVPPPVIGGSKHRRRPIRLLPGV